MQPQDGERWSQQLSEFNADELSRKFRDFLVFWVDAGEVLLAEDGRLTPRDSLLRAFEVAEQTFGYISAEWLGQMLLVLVEHWFEGARLWESLSAWERRAVEQAAALKLVELQETAATAGQDTP